MEFKIGCQYSLLIINNERIHCEIRSETQTNLYIVCFEIIPGIRHTSDRMNEIPEAILDERKILELLKRDIICSVGIYIVNEKYFKDSFMKYKFGRINIFRIRHMYKQNMNEKELITSHMYPYTTYGSLLENPNRTWKQMSQAIKLTNHHVNCSIIIICYVMKYMKIYKTS